MKVVCGLGNPGPEYDATRHNVGWWALDRVAYDWAVGPFRRERAALLAETERAGERVRLVKPMTYMNRSGAALAPLRFVEGFDVARDLLVVVDDFALPVGRVRLRARGSAGGHNGLKSIEAALGTPEYTRLRIGVGVPPPGADPADWVLSPFPAEEEEQIVAMLPMLAEAVAVWVREGVEAARARLTQ